MKDYSIILFDLDGTISDSGGGIISCIKYALKNFGIDENDSVVLRGFVGPPMHRRLMDLYGFTKEETDRVVAKYREKYEIEGVYDNVLYPGIEKMLKNLKAAGKTVCVATSKPEETAVAVLKNFEIYHYFDYVVGAQKHGPRQNKDQVIEELFKRASITDNMLSQVVMVGDTNYDIEGANKMKVDSIGVNYGYGNKEDMLSSGAVTVVETVKELEELLLH